MNSFLKYRGKERVKFLVDVHLKKVSNLNNIATDDEKKTTPVYIACSKGKRREITTSKLDLTSDMTVNEILTFTSTLFYDNSTDDYLEKELSLVLKKAKGKKGKLLSWKLDVSKFAKLENTIEYTVGPVVKKSKPNLTPTLSMSIRCIRLDKDFLSSLPTEVLQMILEQLHNIEQQNFGNNLRNSQNGSTNKNQPLPFKYDTLLSIGRTCKSLNRVTCDLVFRMGLLLTREYIHHEKAIDYYSKAILLDPTYIPAFLMRGKELLRKGDRSIAIDDLKKALSLNPSDIEQHVIRSIISGVHGSYQDSIDEANKGLITYPNEPMLYFERAFSKHDLLDYQGTIDDYSMCLSLKSSSTYLYPGSFLVFNNRGWAYEMMNQLIEAANDYTKSYELNPTYIRALRGRARVMSKLGTKASLKLAVIDLFRAVIAEPKESTTYDRYLHYRPQDPNDNSTKITNNDIAAMIEAAKIAMGNDADEASKMYSSAFIKQDLGDFDGAIEDYTQSINMGYEYAYLAYNNRGRVNHKKGDIDRAIEDYTKAIETTPSSVAKSFMTALGNRCSALSSKGDVNGALKDSIQMTKLDPKNSYGHRLHASVLVDHHRRNEAMDYLREAIQRCPLDDAILEMAGIFHFEAGNREAAIRDLSDAIRLNPKSFEAYSYRARSRSALGDVSGAINDCKEMIRLEKNNHVGHSLYAAILADHKKFDDAIEAASQAIKITPRVTYRHRAEIHSKKGDIASAINDYESALSHNPNDVFAMKQRAYARAVLNDHNGSLQDYTAALGLGANDLSIINNLGVERSLAGDYNGAVSLIANALQSHPNDHHLLWNRIIIMMKLNNHYDRILEDLNRLLLLLSNNRSNSNNDSGDYNDDLDEVRVLHLKVSRHLKREKIITIDDARSIQINVNTLYFKYDPAFEPPIGRTKARLPKSSTFEAS